MLRGSSPAHAFQIQLVTMFRLARDEFFSDRLEASPGFATYGLCESGSYSNNVHAPMCRAV